MHIDFAPYGMTVRMTEEEYQDYAHISRDSLTLHREYIFKYRPQYVEIYAITDKIIATKMLEKIPNHIIAAYMMRLKV